MDPRSPTRRDTLVALAAGALFPAGVARAELAPPRLIAGTYRREGGAGLYPLTPTSRGWQVDAPMAMLRDLSFGVRTDTHHYWVEEHAKGRLIVTDREERLLASLSSGGDDPCHVAIDPAGRHLAVANYTSGTVAIYRVGRNGIPAAPVIRQHRGQGPNPLRQRGPHAHWVGFSADGRFLHSVDLGADAIFLHPLRGAGEPGIAWRAPAGSGPRHLVRHPARPIAYVVTELGNELLTLRALRDGRFVTIRRQSLLPTGATGASYAAHIAIDRAARRLYVSNRGHDSIAVFALAGNGDARLLQHIACGGHWPRFFLLIEDAGLCLVANERSGTVAVLRLLPDGRLAATGELLSVPGVACLARA